MKKIFNWFKKPKKSKELVVDILKLPIKAQKNLGLRTIISYAEKSGYKIKQVNYSNGMIRYCKGDTCINLYTTTGTISTEIHHPKKGKTQLHRKGLNLTQMRSVFDDPRVHTGKGYYKRK